MLVNDTPIGHDHRHGRPTRATKTSLQQRLSARARERWPELAGIDVKFRGEFAYVTGRLKDGDTQPLMRLRYRRISRPLGLRDLPGQQRRLRNLRPADRHIRRRTRRRPGHRLRALPRRPHRLDLNPRRTDERDHLVPSSLF